MKEFKVGKLRLEEKELKADLGKGNTIFVGSSVDMFANAVPDEWIARVLLHCKKFPENTYLFQSKNPYRFIAFGGQYPEHFILGTTIETDKDYNLSGAPYPLDRMAAMAAIAARKMVSIEPIMDFDLDGLVQYIKFIKPEFVSIGADSKGNNLPEPLPKKVKALVKELNKFTETRLKGNISRLFK